MARLVDHRISALLLGGLVLLVTALALMATSPAARAIADPDDPVDAPIFYAPSAPVLYGPADLGTLLSAQVPTLRWQPAQPGSAPVADYRILLDGQPAALVDATQTSWTPPAPIPDGGHVWLVIAVDARGSESSAARQTFSVDTRVPSPTLLVLSAMPVTAGTPVIFDATVAPESSPPIVRYDWDLDGSGAFARDTGASPSTTAAWSKPGDPTVRVRVTDIFGRTSVVSVTFPVVAASTAPKVTRVGPVHSPSDRPLRSGHPAVTISPDGDGIDDVATVTATAKTATWMDAEVRGWAGRVSGWRSVWVSPLAHGKTVHLSWAGQVAGGKRTARDGPYQLQVCWYAPTAPAKAVKRAHRTVTRTPVTTKAQQRFTHLQAVVDDDDVPLTRAQQRSAQEISLAERHPGLGLHHCVSRTVDIQVQRLTVSVPSAGSYAPGGSVPVDVSSDQASLVVSLRPASHNPAAPVAYATVTPGVTGSITVPGDAPAGLYQLEAQDEHGAISQVYVVVRDGTHPLEAPAPDTALVVWPELTWRAYNGFDSDRDGIPDSWYELWSQHWVSLTGPLQPDEHDLAQSESFNDWLTAHPAARTEPITDVELAGLDPSVLARYSAVVFPGHSEYYAQPEYDLLSSYRASGGHLLFLSANSFYRRVEIEPATNQEVLVDQVMRMDGQSDFALASTGYADSGFSTDEPFTVAASAVRAFPWMFAGTGLSAGSTFGVVGTEVDRIDGLMSPPQTQLVASAHLQGTTNVVDADMAWTAWPGGGSEFSSGDFDFLSDDITSWQLLANVWNHDVGPLG